MSFNVLACGFIFWLIGLEESTLWKKCCGAILVAIAIIINTLEVLNINFGV